MQQLPALRLRLALALAAAVCVAPAAGLAASKIKIAGIGDGAPGGGLFAGPGLTGAPVAAGNGWVTFRTRIIEGGTAEQIIGQNLNSGSAERFEVASLGKPAGKWNQKDLGTFKQFLGRPTINANGDVAFVALLTNSDALPASFIDPQPAGVFLCVHSGPNKCRLRAVIVSREKFTGLGALDFTLPVNPLEESSSPDLLERTPGLNTAKDVAFTAVTVSDFSQSAGIFVAPGGADAAPVVPKGSVFGDERRFDSFGPPSINAAGTLAFRATYNDGAESGVFTFADGTATRLVKDGDAFADPGDVDNTQFIADFADLVALNDAGDVACSPGNLFDINGTAIDGEFGTLVIPHGATPQLLAFPGRDILGFGRIVGGSLGPDGGSKVAPPSLMADGTVYFFAELSTGFGQAFFRALPPDYEVTIPIIVFGGDDPDPSPIGGFYSAAVSGPAVDAVGNLAFFTRLAGAVTTEALIFRPLSGPATSVIVGDGSPTGDGFFAGPPFSSAIVNDADTVVFKSFVARGRSSLGIFRWREADGVTVLVRTGDAAPVGGAKRFLDLPGDVSLNAAGAIAFAALVEGSGRGVFAQDPDGTVRKIAQAGDLLYPGTTDDKKLDNVAANPVMLADGSVVFRGTFSYRDPVNPLGKLREEGIFRVDQSGTLAILARTGEDSPTGQPFFRFRDPSANGGMSVVFRAPIGDRTLVADPNLLPVGLFLVDPAATVTALALQDQTLGPGMKLSGLTGRPTIDTNGDVAFLAKLARGDDDHTALLRRSADGTVTNLAEVGGKGPIGGVLRGVSRPAMSSAGHVAFRGTFEPFSGASTAYYVASPTGTAPLVQIGESSAVSTSGRISSLNPSASVNASGHLAFIGSVTDGNTRNALFLASSTTTTAEAFRVRLGRTAGKDTIRGRIRLKAAALPGRAAETAKADKGAVSVVVSDTQQTLLTANVSPGALTRRGATLVPKGKVKSLRRLSVRLDRSKNMAVVTFASAPADLTFGGLALLQPPFTIRVDVGGDSGSVTIDCDVTRKAVVCPGL